MATYDAFIPDFSSQTLFQAEAPSLRFLATVAPLLVDSIAPEVDLVSPPEDTALTKMQPIVLDVTDNASLGLHGILVEYPDIAGLYEVGFDGVYPVTRGAYLVSRVAITGGFRYTILRRGGWPSRPRLRVFATDGGIGEVF